MSSSLPFTRESAAIISSPKAALLSHWLGMREYSKYRKFYENFLSPTVLDSEFAQSLISITHKPARPQPARPAFTFIDLFAGIGGMRLAAEMNDGVCVFSSEWDKYAQQTYFRNFGEIPFGDIMKIHLDRIPEADMLIAGFPCQSFSMAGYRKGFKDTRGTLFFQVEKIIKQNHPQFVLLENVKGLVNHDKGHTLDVILGVLRDKLGYFVPKPQILNSRNFGVAQNRERIFIVGFRDEEQAKNFQYPEPRAQQHVVQDILEKNVVDVKYYLSTSTLQMLRDHKERHSGKGNGFGLQILDRQSVANSLVVGGMGRERNLVVDRRIYRRISQVDRAAINSEGIRRMTPREFQRLQGFPATFSLPVSDNQSYRQFGNSVTVPVVKAVIRSILAASK